MGLPTEEAALNWEKYCLVSIPTFYLRGVVNSGLCHFCMTVILQWPKQGSESPVVQYLSHRHFSNCVDYCPSQICTRPQQEHYVKHTRLEKQTKVCAGLDVLNEQACKITDRKLKFQHQLDTLPHEASWQAASCAHTIIS